MLNICSFWEINPLTNRVRVRAPKTKAEPYPDYDSEEEETARLVAGLCNRSIPYSKDGRTRQARGRATEGDESGSESGSVISGEGAEDEEASYERKRTSTKRKRKFNDAFNDEQEYRNDSDYDEEQHGDKRRRKTGRLRAEHERHSRSMDKEHFKQGKSSSWKNAGKIAGRKRKRSPTDGFTITSDDYRRFRRSVYDNSNRRKESRNRRAESPSRVDSDQLSENATAHDSEDDYDKQESISRTQDSRAARRYSRERSVIVENPAHKFKRRRTGDWESPAGRVTTVRKAASKSAQSKFSGKRGRPKNISRASTPENVKSVHDEPDSDDAVLDSASNFWSR
ncbi:Oidioi.mRNA.OKI2018_I69.chr2.g7965.t1.cds [Oikopleura dioica]|uniref:Oidioi.mRNA.OKI2018_I69.chr2.g7965.t1.cds n=1 Tax=Oikopleura dioica TaxID=34765 RepID=A0ABN7TCI3_OIKDI|nr:Oidioi.mRNA.OKI2018_I69.chr2.g7965.t1.cds [Oikopleura dioica]